MLSICQSNVQLSIEDANSTDPDIIYQRVLNSNSDFRIFYYNNGTLIFGRDIFGRKSLCCRIIKSDDGSVDLILGFGFLKEKNLDLHELLSGVVYRVNNFHGNVESIGDDHFRIHFTADELSNATLLIHSSRALGDLYENPLHKLFGKVDVNFSDDYSAYFKPCNDFAFQSSDEILDKYADELISRLSDSIGSIFTPELIFGESFHGNVPDQLSICFSGGVDSLTVATLAATVLTDIRQINLINTVFLQPGQTEAQSSDRLKGLEAFEWLSERFGPNRFSMVLVDVDHEEVERNRPAIERAMLPNSTILDESLASVLWFGCRAAGKQIFPSGHQGLEFVPSNCALVGSGADELLGGYARHRSCFERGGFEELHSELQMEMQRVGERNYGRDDRVALSNGVHLLGPFLQNDLVKWIQRIPLSVRVDFSLPRGRGEKRLLRRALERLGAPPHLTDTPKRAMQFGSGYAKLENRGRKGGDRADGL